MRYMSTFFSGTLLPILPIVTSSLIVSVNILLYKLNEMLSEHNVST